MIHTKAESKRKLIFVMGVQRSGTTALLDTLGQDPNLRVEDEHVDSPFFHAYYLRPEPVLRAHIHRIRRRILLKAISETYRRTVEDVLDEFARFEPMVAWIYRDPVDVWRSARAEFRLDDRELEQWLADWNRRNTLALDTLVGRHANRIAIVSYSDLQTQRGTFRELCRFLDIRPRNNLFWHAGQSKGRTALPLDLQRSIDEATKTTLAELRSRRIQPPPHQDLQDSAPTFMTTA